MRPVEKKRVCKPKIKRNGENYSTQETEKKKPHLASSEGGSLLSTEHIGWSEHC